MCRDRAGTYTIRISGQTGNISPAIPGGVFADKSDANLDYFLQQLQNAQIQVVAPELLFGKIYDSIGFNAVEEDLFRHLVISRLAFPLSKLKAIDYLNRFVAYTILKELERVLHRAKSNISVKQAAELAHNMYQIDTLLPKSKQIKMLC